MLILERAAKMLHGKHLAVILDIENSPFIYEEAEKLGIRITYFYDAAISEPGNLPSVIRYVALPLTGDFVEAMKIIKRVHAEDPIEGVISHYEFVMTFVATVAKELSLRYLPVQTVENCRNKSITRKILRENNLNTPEFILYENCNQIDVDKFKYPLIVKPINGAGSQGVIKVDDRNALFSAIKEISDINRMELGRYVENKTGIIIERFINGSEFAIETFSIAGEVYVLSIGYKGNCQGPYFEENVYIAPANISNDLRQAIADQVISAIKAIGITDGAAHTELRLDQDNKPYVIEIGARIGGAGISSYIVHESTGINLMRLTIENAFYQLTPERIPNPIHADRVAGNYIIPVKGFGKFKYLDGLEKLHSDARVKRILILFHEGAEVLPYPHFSGYPGHIMTSHSTYRECLEFYDYLDNIITPRYECQHI